MMNNKYAESEDHNIRLAMGKKTPEKIAREALDICADCDICRFLMTGSCLYFAELYRLYDREMNDREPITSDDLKRLVHLCNFCGQCPCPNIRAGIIEAKTRFVEREGLKVGVRTLEDVERIGRLCGAMPRLSNRLLQAKTTGAMLKAAIGIHRSRAIPRFPEENFSDWARKNNLTKKALKPSARKLAYFSGCTGKYLFPEVPKAVVEVFRHTGLEIYFPEQKCCGMPSLLEGDRDLTLQMVSFNVHRLAELTEEGYAILCSCPTCGYMLKILLVEGAYFSKEYQALVGDEQHLRFPAKRRSGLGEQRKMETLSKKLYGDIFKDDGYFSSISPIKRIRVAENTYDLGEYLTYLHSIGEFSIDFGPVPDRLIYYPPCHQREQKIGDPYVELLNQVPGLNLETLRDPFYCCGLGGIMGFKKDFHEPSRRLGQTLMEKIRESNPEAVVTDCLSCRMQFNQFLPYNVFHPIEIINKSCMNAPANQRA